VASSVAMTIPPGGVVRYFGFWNASAFVDSAPNGGFTPRNFMSVSASDEFTSEAHGFIDTQAVVFVNGVPTPPLVAGVVYFVRDVGPDDGPFCVVPATHKSNFPTPYGTNDSDVEPGMIGLPVKAGDAILFTEHLRHGGKSIRSGKTRNTLHIGYGPYWMKSQNIATMDEQQHIRPETLARYNEAQRLLFRSW
jgi:ectoine hydroxylase-related dioxygenase (phytanoyl-CoA dioxygenase family)